MPVFVEFSRGKRGEEELARKFFPRYFRILEKNEEAKFKLAKKKGELKKKIKKAFSMLKSCELCEWKCKVNRLKGEKGVCMLTNKMLLSSYFEHRGEEFFLVPSFTIFFWSCNFSCQYCQNWAISQRIEKPKIMSEQRLAKVINSVEGCKNINFVGGEPTIQLPFILKTLNSVNTNLPIIWNSNFYMSEKSIELLKGIVDVYLSDFKYGNDRCAERLSKVKNYFPVVSRNHLLAAADSELLIRHLLLPGHFECCTKPIFEWIAENIKDKALVNIMGQYRPEYKAAEYPELNRFISEEEVNEAIDYAKKLNLNFIT